MISLTVILTIYSVHQEMKFTQVRVDCSNEIICIWLSKMGKPSWKQIKLIQKHESFCLW